jgi:hypothetical protein
MDEQININVQNFGATQKENNQGTNAVQYILNKIQRNKELNKLLANALIKVNPELSISLRKDLNILFTGKAHNTQVLPFSYKDFGLQNAKTIQIYIPDITDTLGANETVTDETINTIMFTVVASYFLAFDWSDKEFMYNGRFRYFANC